MIDTELTALLTSRGIALLAKIDAALSKGYLDEAHRPTALLARSVAHGMLRAGMAHCGKHFPGHGCASANSHVATPVDKRSLKARLADGTQPYEWLSATLTAVMTAHVAYRAVQARTATCCERGLKDVLRGRYGCTGAVCTDDLSMEGARWYVGPEAAVNRCS